MGYLRLLLAVLVLLSHLDVRFFGLNQGVFAVVIFYLLSGSVVSHLWQDVIPNKTTKLKDFYKERILRIFPLYLYILLLSSIFIFSTGYGAPHIALYNLFANLTIIPLDFYMYKDPSILTHPSWWLVPPAWSLGAELQAYIILPLLLGENKKFFWLFFSASLFIYLLANFQVFHPDYFGYRLIVGVLFIFLTGSLLNHKKNFIKLSFFWTFLLGIYIYFYVTKSFHPTYTHETLLGLLVGIPLVYYFKQNRYKLPFDFLAGKLSYGIFLSHFLSVWMFEQINVLNDHGFIYYLKIVFLSTIISLLGVFCIENKIQTYRIGLFKKVKKN